MTMLTNDDWKNVATQALEKINVGVSPQPQGLPQPQQTGVYQPGQAQPMGLPVSRNMAQVGNQSVSYQDIGTQRDPFKTAFTGTGIVPGQAQNSNEIINQLMTQRNIGLPETSAKYQDEVQRAMRANAAQGFAPSPEQLRITGMNPQELTYMLSSNNQRGRFDAPLAQIGQQQMLGLEEGKLQNDRLQHLTQLAKLDQPKFQDLGTSPDGRPVIFNPHTGIREAVNADGTRTPYMGQVQGKMPAGQPGSSTELPANASTMNFSEIAKKLGFRESALTNALLRKIEKPEYTPFSKFHKNKSDNILFENAYGNLLEKYGISPDEVATMGKDVKAATKAYIKTAENKAMVDQAVEQSRNNAKLVLEANNNYKRLGYPAPNKFWDYAQKHLSSTERAQFELSLLAFSREYMRVTTGGARSASELSVGAQKNVDEILSRFDSWDVLNKKIEQAQKEIDAVPQSYDRELNKIRKQIKGVYKNFEGGDSGGGLGLSVSGLDMNHPNTQRAIDLLAKDMKRPVWQSAEYQQRVWNHLRSLSYTKEQIEEMGKLAAQGVK